MCTRNLLAVVIRLRLHSLRFQPRVDTAFWYVSHDLSPCDKKVSLDPTTEHYSGEGWYPESRSRDCPDAPTSVLEKVSPFVFPSHQKMAWDTPLWVPLRESWKCHQDLWPLMEVT